MSTRTNTRASLLSYAIGIAGWVAIWAGLAVIGVLALAEVA
jgi:hypothetical protein